MSSDAPTSSQSIASPRGLGATRDDARFIHTEWHRRARNRDVASLAQLYTEDAVLESPLLPRLLHVASGRVVGRTAIERFLRQGTLRRPDPLVRWFRTDQYLFDGRTLVWEYPREAPDGQQIDIIEVCDLAGPHIANHRIYWGWFGTEMLLGNRGSGSTDEISVGYSSGLR